MMRGWSAATRDDLITLPIARDRQNRLYGLPWELRIYGCSTAPTCSRPRA
jgi:hypothetical protein